MSKNQTNNEEQVNEGYTPFSEIPYSTCVATAADSVRTPTHDSPDNDNDHEEGAMFTFAQSEPAPVEDGYHYGFIDQNFDDDDYDETQPHEEVFYANGNGNGNDTVNDNVNENGSTCSTGEEIKDEQQEIQNMKADATNFDFSLLADQALKSLEMEYTQTIQSELLENEVEPAVIPKLEVEPQVDLAPKHDDDRQHTSDHETLAAMTDTDCQHDALSLSRPQDQNRKPIPNINTAAVTKAIQNISLSAPNLDQKLSQWKPSHPSYTPLAIPSTHPIIPSKPFMAFKRHTHKAKAASANLTRSATLAESVDRLFIHPAKINRTMEDSNFVHNQDEIFVIHCIGADRVECQTTDTIRKALGPFIKWMHQYQHFEHGIGMGIGIGLGMGDGHAPRSQSQSPPSFQWPKHIRIEMLGPNVPPHAEQFGVLNLLPRIPGRLESATVVCRNCMYHDHLQALEDDIGDCKDDDNGRKRSASHSMHFPNLVIVYNAGIWGYTDWHPTLRKLYEFERAVPFVITAYTIYEAEDDFEVLEEVLGVSLAMSGGTGGVRSGDGDGDRNGDGDGDDGRCLWSTELNPFASRVVRETKSSDNTYFENGAWQAYVMGKIQ